jgi:predicted TIM-barrel fold metal-dependent hydrolase
MRTITLEEHFITGSFVKATEAHGHPTPPQMQRMHALMQDLGAGRIAAMDEAGIDLQILSLAAMGLDVLDSQTATAVLHDVNDELAQAIAANPTRLGGFAAVNLKDPAGAAKELERCIHTLGFQGLLLDGTTDGLFLDDPRFLPVLEAAVALDVPVYLHPALPPEPVQQAYFSGLPGDTGFLLSMAGWGWHSETAIHTLRLIAAGVFDRLPKLQLVIGHMGEMLPIALARTSAVLARSGQLKRPAAEYFQSNIHLTTSGYFTQPPLRCALDVVGIDRVMFSVDYPFSPNTHGRGFLTAAAETLDAGSMEKLTHGNAERLLKLSA